MWQDMLHSEMHDTSGSQRSFTLGLVSVHHIMEQIVPYVTTFVGPIANVVKATQEVIRCMHLCTQLMPDACMILT